MKKIDKKFINHIFLTLTMAIFLIFFVFTPWKIVFATIVTLTDRPVDAVVTVIDVQSHPALGGNWTVRFNTTGTADLTVRAVDGTEFGRDIEFFELRCGDRALATEIADGAVFAEGYSCDEIGYVTSKILIAGDHTLEFRFGDDVKHAYNSPATLYVYYNTGDDGQNPPYCYGSAWNAQTFKTGASQFKITSVKLKLHRAGTETHTLTIGIRATSGGQPSGSDLTSGTLQTNVITTPDPGAWYEIPVTPYSLSANTVYAIYMTQPTAAWRQVVYWRADKSSPAYADGQYWQSGTGYAYDAMFEIWGDTCKANGVSCSPGECCSNNCVDGYCCNSACGGNCDSCNVAGSPGTCTNVDAVCTGNCDVCSGGNCVASNALCSNTDSSCYCSGSGMSFNCQACGTGFQCASYACVLSGWKYRKSHVINSASGAGTNYQVKIVAYGTGTTGTDSGENVYLGSNVRSDFGDVRFTDSSGNLLDYWIERNSSSSATTTTQCCSAAENAACTATCPSGTTITQVKYVKYGASACANLGACDSSVGANCANSPSCVGQTSCTWTFSNANCGDTCSGYVKTGYLTVTCVPSAIFWVEVAGDLGTAAQTIYIYYGKADATTSNGGNTFLLFDDFNDGSFDTNKWQQYSCGSGTVSETGGYLRLLSTGSPGRAYLRSKDQQAKQICLELKMKYEDFTTNGQYHTIIHWDGTGVSGSWCRTNNAFQFDEDGDNPNAKDRLMKLVNNVETIDSTVAITRDNNWHRLMLCYYNNVLIGQKDAATPLTWTDAQNFATTYVGVSGRENANTISDVDDVRVRKYVSPEPAHSSWGSEELLCKANGVSCSPGECCSGNCKSDYDGNGAWCCDSTQCAHDGCYNSGTKQCYGDIVEYCNAGSWGISENCGSYSGVYPDSATDPPQCSGYDYSSYLSANQTRKYYCYGGACDCNVTYDSNITQVSVNGVVDGHAAVSDTKNITVIVKVNNTGKWDQGWWFVGVEFWNVSDYTNPYGTRSQKVDTYYNGKSGAHGNLQGVTGADCNSSIGNDTFNSTKDITITCWVPASYFGITTGNQRIMFWVHERDTGQDAGSDGCGSNGCPQTQNGCPDGQCKGGSWWTDGLSVDDPANVKVSINLSPCSDYTNEGSCKLKPDCAWCPLDGKCKDKTGVVCINNVPNCTNPPLCHNSPGSCASDCSKCDYTKNCSGIPLCEIGLVVWCEKCTTSCGDGYCECGETSDTCSNDCTKTNGNFTIYPGWNLISIPFWAVTEIEPEKDPCGIFSKYFYYFDSRPTTKGWKSLDWKGLEGGRGYWVFSEKDGTCEVNVTGRGSLISVNNIPVLERGYNAVGAPSGSNSIDTCGDSDNIITVDGNYALYWNALAQQWATTNTLEAGKGYWIRVNEKCTFSS